MVGVLTNNERTIMAGRNQGKDVLPLGLLGEGEKAIVIEMVGGKHMCTRVEDMGIRDGKSVEVLKNEGRGPVLIKVNESRIAISRGMAMKIMVKKI